MPVDVPVRRQDTLDFRNLTYGDLVACYGAIAPLTDAVENEQGGADRDRAVGDIEGGEIRAAPVKEEEIDDVTERQAIPEIAQRAAQDQGEPGTVPAISAAPKKPDDEHCRCERDRGKEVTRPARDTAHEAECHAGIEREHNAEEFRHDALLPRVQGRDHRQLGELIGDNDHGA